LRIADCGFIDDCGLGADCGLIGEGGLVVALMSSASARIRMPLDIRGIAKSQMSSINPQSVESQIPHKSAIRNPQSAM
jgi:hypothetical protein